MPEAGHKGRDYRAMPTAILEPAPPGLVPGDDGLPEAGHKGRDYRAPTAILEQAAPGLAPGNASSAEFGHKGRDYRATPTVISEVPDAAPLNPDLQQANAEAHPKITRQHLMRLPAFNTPAPDLTPEPNSDVSAAATNSSGPEAADPELPTDSIASDADPSAELSADLQERRGIAAETSPSLAEESPQQPSAAPIAPKKRRASVQVAGAWGAHEALLAQLDQLSWDCRTGEWAGRIAELVRELGRIEDPSSPRALVTLGRLRDLSERDHPVLAAVYDRPEAAALRRIRFAVVRRLEFWEMVPEMASPRVAARKTVSLRSSEAAPPRNAVELPRLLGHLERFERTGLSDDGRELAVDVGRLAIDGGPAAARIRHWLEANYRNSNLRVVVSADFLNRYVPK
ncbi:MAG: hypothetical protein ACREJM_07285, partial [Candidatus Saccharimonadales bacterium]